MAFRPDVIRTPFPFLSLMYTLAGLLAWKGEARDQLRSRGMRGCRSAGRGELWATGGVDTARTPELRLVWPAQRTQPLHDIGMTQLADVRELRP